MQKLGNTAPEAPGQASVVAPGNHDGVHLGHRALIQAARTRAEREGLRVIALTFDPHPAEVLAPERVPPRLTTIERRCELLRKAGADQVIVQRFGADFASLTPEQFLRHSLVETLRARVLVVGPDFGFGVKRSGTVDTLLALGKHYGLEIVVVPPVRLGDRQVSSSAIREAIAAGEMEQAAAWLGRVHEICGRVVEGERRGRKLGAPTANLICEPVLKPADGVYAVAARRINPESDTLYMGVINLGVRPTFGGGPTVEVHLMDYSGDLYGAEMRVGFVKRLRGEAAFPDVDKLSAQINKDIVAARQTLKDTDQRMLSWI